MEQQCKVAMDSEHGKMNLTTTGTLVFSQEKNNETMFSLAQANSLILLMKETCPNYNLYIEH